MENDNKWKFSAKLEKNDENKGWEFSADFNKGEKMENNYTNEYDVNNEYHEESNNSSNLSSIKSELKETSKDSKRIKSIISILEKEINSIEKLESHLNKNKNKEKDFLNNYDSCLNNSKSFKNSIREEKYHLEQQLLKNSKRIDRLKDELANSKK